METETKPRMSVAEVALMRAIVLYRRVGGPINPRADFYRRRWHVIGGEWLDVAYDIQATDDPEDGYAIVLYSRGRYASYEKAEVRTVTQAVDLLVTFGYLPQRFSSAYAAGWHAASVWYDPKPESDELGRLFHDPENISFPAVGDEA